MASAEPGEVLISGTVHDPVAGSPVLDTMPLYLPHPTELRDLPEPAGP
jgi:hypothetical protein